jgi:hypothetical protein
MVRSDDGKDTSNRGPSCPYFVSGMEIVCPGLLALARLEERMPWIVMSASEARLLGKSFSGGLLACSHWMAGLLAVAGSGGQRRTE